MSWFTFIQNNSGGSFHNDDRVSHYVVIEASSGDEANTRAESIGIYFNGCASGYDCDCCGDRWRPVWGDEDGEDTPSIYGEEIFSADGSVSKDFTWRDTIHVYRADGTHSRVFEADGAVVHEID
jgi:hypothetical protein